MFLIVNLLCEFISHFKTVFQHRKFIWRAVWWTWEMYINSH